MAKKKVDIIVEGRQAAAELVSDNPYKGDSWQALAWVEGWQSWHDDAAVTKKELYQAAVDFKIVATPREVVCRKVHDARRKADATLARLAQRASFRREMSRLPA